MAASISDILNLTNPVLRAYLFYSAVLMFKMLSMSFLTARQRFAKHVFANPEDLLSKAAKVKYDDQDVERVRRAHLNDIENIPVFIVAAGIYVLTNPSAWLAINLFRLFAAARILHTLVYAVFVIPQPARVLSFGAGVAVTGYILLQDLLFFAA